MKARVCALVCIAWLKDSLKWASTYLPVLLMGVLAMGTWWLVKNSPVFDGPRESTPPGHAPDYTMENVSVRRFDPQGHLRTHIQGQQLRHYPDTDTIEIDHVRLRAIGLKGEITTGQGLLGWSNRDGSELRLQGAARVTREATAGEPTLTFLGESMTARLHQKQVTSDHPLTIERQGVRVTADTMTYDSLSGVAQAQGRVQVTYQAPAAAAKINKK
jgi:lipopolysaccharide export system protein LptC